MTTNYSNMDLSNLSTDKLSRREAELLQLTFEEPYNEALLDELGDIQDELAQREAQDLAADGWSEQSCW